MITKAEIDRIHEMEKVMEEDWQWRRRGSNFTEEATVYCLDEGITLTMKGWKRNTYGFCLLYKGSRIVRRWDQITPHENPDGKKIHEPHKHYWDEEYEDRIAYPVGNEISTTDVDQAFRDFLDEENIEHTGSYIRQEALDEQ